jgi:hypothetical protein
MLFMAKRRQIFLTEQRKKNLGKTQRKSGVKENEYIGKRK